MRLVVVQREEQVAQQRAVDTVVPRGGRVRGSAASTCTHTSQTQFARHEPSCARGPGAAIAHPLIQLPTVGRRSCRVYRALEKASEAAEGARVC